MLTSSELSTLVTLLEFASRERSQNKDFSSLLKKFQSLNNIGVKQVPVFDTSSLEECIFNLQQIKQEYLEVEGGSSVEILETLKKKLVGELEFLATQKDEFIETISYYEDVLKDEVKSKLLSLIQKEQGISINQAEKVVKGDVRYTEYRDNILELKIFALKLKSIYDVYSKMWNGLIQSISISKKEQNQTK